MMLRNPKFGKQFFLYAAIFSFPGRLEGLQFFYSVVFEAVEVKKDR